MNCSPASVGAVNIELSAQDLRTIEQQVSKIEVHGARYSEAAQKLVNR